MERLTEANSRSGRRRRNREDASLGVGRAVEEPWIAEEDNEDDDDDLLEAYFDEQEAHYDGYVNSRDLAGGAAAFSNSSKIGSLQPREHKIGTLDRFVNAGKVKLSQTATNDIRRGEKKQQGFNRIQGRDDRATTEQVMDPRTRLILFKMLSRGTFDEINGCISTGKEANVYHAVTSEGQDLAVKVFKTSILVFKDRDKYVTGEHRFRGGYGKSNPRKMVKLWAEKEMRNLKRLHAAGIVCPEPHMLRMHVLVMDFVGKNGWPAPRLKDAVLSSSKYRSAYVQCLFILRKMFQLCKLVHGDFSEYNLLVLDGTIYVIDVSQSVEMDHPRALEFLRMDIQNTNAFFKKKGLDTMPLTAAFQFIVDKSFGCAEPEMEAALDTIQRDMESGALTREQQDQLEVDQQVFLHSFIPTNLSQVADIERESDLVATVQDRKLAHIMTGIDTLQDEAAAEQPDAAGAAEDQDEDTDGDADDDDGDEDTDGEEGVGDASKPFTVKGSDRDARKEHKKLVKQARAEKRLTKVPKHVKKRAKNISRQNSKKGK
ncbi:Serine/threonine-protein kinase RIO1 (RIO kinase 1) [Durusdinium trenchii]|uniref:Serine/threonine-protein kinase RIO1 n=1 Tax=Durusdinium trenchii TaxID=1381693 RepID=A0ABP0L6F1_9DINO